MNGTTASKLATGATFTVANYIKSVVVGYLIQSTKVGSATKV